MTTTVVAALSRLVLGAAYASAALLWVLATHPQTVALVTLGGRQLTRADLPAVPLLCAGALLAVLAVVGRRARAAAAATVLLAAFGAVGWLGTWWLAVAPEGEGDIVAPISPSHGVTESDLVAVPTLLVAVVCGLAGLLALWRAAASEPDRGDGEGTVAVRALFGGRD
jgi:hypothetical protein